jgi:uncharacterized protein YdeI (YjbR/CyaY-like superfamily)
MRPTFFATPGDFRRWLRAHHDTADELLVGFYKKGSGRPSITWPESVDEALCFGWIDGIRRTLDAESYTIRFTPRRKGSIWSDVNTRRARALVEEGRMQPAGLRAFEARDHARSGLYSFEQRRTVKLGSAAEALFKANAKAWAFFTAQPPGYRRVATWFVISAKRDDTRARRLEVLIRESGAGRRIGMDTRIAEGSEATETTKTATTKKKARRKARPR